MCLFSFLFLFFRYNSHVELKEKLMSIGIHIFPRIETMKNRIAMPQCHPVGPLTSIPYLVTIGFELVSLDLQLDVPNSKGVMATSSTNSIVFLNDAILS